MDNSENWKRNRKISKVNKWKGRESQRKKSAGECEEERERKREQNLNSRADRGQREVGGAVGRARVTVTAAAFKHRCTLGRRTGQKHRDTDYRLTATKYSNIRH